MAVVYRALVSQECNCLNVQYPPACSIVSTMPIRPRFVSNVSNPMNMLQRCLRAYSRVCNWTNWFDSGKLMVYWSVNTGHKVTLFSTSSWAPNIISLQKYLCLLWNNHVTGIHNLSLQLIILLASSICVYRHHQLMTS